MHLKVLPKTWKILKKSVRNKLFRLFLQTPYQLVNTSFALVLAGLFVYFAWAPSDEVNLLSCSYKKQFGTYCYTCGLTRAFSDIMHLDFKSALGLNADAIRVFMFFLIQFFGRLFLNIIAVRTNISTSKLVIGDVAISLLLLLFCFWNIFKWNLSLL